MRSPSIEELLYPLCYKVKVLSVPQVASLWFCDSMDPVAAANEALNGLEELGFVTRRTVFARPLQDLSQPVFSWNPDEPTDPNFGTISWKLRSRWKAPPVVTEIVTATEASKRHVGGYIADPVIRSSETTHDLHVAQIYLHFREHRAEEAALWQSERSLYGSNRSSYPDAVITDALNNVALVVECGGSYGKSKVMSFHRENKHVRYEIW